MFEAFTLQQANANEKQTTLAWGAPDSIWGIVRKKKIIELKNMLAMDPSQIRKTDPAGANPLHLCFLYGSEVHIEMARLIMKHCPDLIAAEYEVSHLIVCKC